MIEPIFQTKTVCHEGDGRPDLVRSNRRHRPGRVGECAFGLVAVEAPMKSFSANGKPTTAV